MTGLDLALVVILVSLSIAGLNWFTGFTRRWIEQYKLIRECPHPQHRIYQMFTVAGTEEYMCDECGCLLELYETEEDE